MARAALFIKNLEGKFSSLFLVDVLSAYLKAVTNIVTCSTPAVISSKVT